jgi:hypothetical protein
VATGDPREELPVIGEQVASKIESHVEARDQKPCSDETNRQWAPLVDPNGAYEANSGAQQPSSTSKAPPQAGA